MVHANMRSCGASSAEACDPAGPTRCREGGVERRATSAVPRSRQTTVKLCSRERYSCRSRGLSLTATHLGSENQRGDSTRSSGRGVRVGQNPSDPKLSPVLSVAALQVADLPSAIRSRCRRHEPVERQARGSCRVRHRADGRRPEDHAAAPAEPPGEAHLRAPSERFNEVEARASGPPR